jgi:phosphoglycolate phosphatase-like HAD superfamily hydrolase
MRNRWWSLSVLIAILVAGLSLSAFAAEDPLPSWNEGPAKQAIIKFVQDTTDKASPNYVPPEERLATFDQDGTLWVEQPIYTQIVFALDRVVELAPKHPEWNKKQPFKAVIARDRAAMAKFSDKDLEKIMVATHTGMSTDEFGPIAKAWLERAKDSRWKRPYTELIYQPMLEVMQYLRDNGYTTYIVTGGGQEFVRVYADKVYGIPREHIIGSAIKTKFTYAKDGKPILMRPPKLLLNDNFSGKPEDIYLFTGRSPQAAFGNSTGDREMLEYSHAGGGATLVMLVLHDDAEREYAYGPAQGLPASKVGTFTQALYDEATKNGWSVISMKKDWKVIFPFDTK